MYSDKKSSWYVVVWFFVFREHEAAESCEHASYVFERNSYARSFDVVQTNKSVKLCLSRAINARRNSVCQIIALASRQALGIVSRSRDWYITRRYSIFYDVIASHSPERLLCVLQLHLFEFNSLEDLEIFVKRYLYLVSVYVARLKQLYVLNISSV